MSVDLAFLIVRGAPPVVSFAHTIIEAGSDPGVHEKIKRLPDQPAPENFSTYLARNNEGEPCYGKLTDDCYGRSLRMVRAGDLAKIKLRTESERIRAAMAYVRALDPDTRIVLFWS